MLYQIATQFPNDMASDEGGPHISLYMPTHRQSPESKQDAIVFKNLLKEIADSLSQTYETSFIESIMKPLYELEKDRDFWNGTLDGMAVLANQNKCIVYRLHRPVKELAVVNDRFHIKPLIQAFQAAEHYQLLALNRDDFSLYEGNRYGVSAIALDPAAPRTSEDVLGKQQTEPSLDHGTFGGAGGAPVYFGQGDKKAEDNKDTEKYFRYVDHYVYENYSKESKLPLILVSLKEYHTQFRKKSVNPYLMEESIDCSYDLVEPKQLQSEVLKISEALDLGRTETVIEAYRKAEAESLGSSDLGKIAEAAHEGRVETIIEEEDMITPGKIAGETGKIESCDIANPDCGDALNDLAVLVLAKGGKVIMVQKDKMPSKTGIAAIYRYK